MINKQVISIDNLTNGTTVETFSPFTMVLSTSAYVSTNKIWKVVYNFGDGNYTEKVLTLNPNSYDPYLPLNTEPGDPRNVPVEHTYYFDDSPTKNFSVSVNFYRLGFSSPENVSFTLSLTLPKIADVFASTDTIKLVGSRIFGLENQLIYLFESQNPNYLIPVLAKW